MNKILIVDASESDRRHMSALLSNVGYEPIVVGTIEEAKDAVAKLPPGAAIVAGLRFSDGTAKELVNWKTQARMTPAAKVDLTPENNLILTP